MVPKVPLSTLRVFEAAARRRSFQAAATELNLTPSAVSHAVRKMEKSLGVVLFERVGRGVGLSSEGQTLMGYTERAFEELQRGMEAVAARAPRLLRLHSAPSFAAQWLTPRLARFFAQHPDVDVRLSAGYPSGTRQGSCRIRACSMGSCARPRRSPRTRIRPPHRRPGR